MVRDFITGEPQASVYIRQERFDHNRQLSSAVLLLPQLLPCIIYRISFGGPGRIRTFNPLLRRQMLYPLSYGTTVRRVEFAVHLARHCLA